MPKKRKTKNSCLFFQMLVILLIVAVAFLVYNSEQNIFGLAGIGGVKHPPPDTTPDVTQYIQELGNPLISRYPDNYIARAPKDMEEFNGRIYLAYGDSTANVGSYVSQVMILYYDPVTGQFIDEYGTNDEAVRLYQEFGALYAVGEDPRQGGNVANLYINENNAWRTSLIPNAQHLWNTHNYDGKIFVNKLAGAGNVVVSVSSDNGQTWQETNVVGEWTGTFFVLEGYIYVQVLVGRSQKYFRYVGDTTFTEVSLDMDTLRNKEHKILQKVIYYNNKIVYTNSLQSTLFTASTTSSIQKYVFSSGEGIMDIIKSRDADGVEKIFVLTSKISYDSNGNIVHVGKVYSSTDLATWKPLFRFTETNEPAQFESFGGSFYFGLVIPYGSRTGTIIMLNAGDVPIQ